MNSINQTKQTKPKMKSGNKIMRIFGIIVTVMAVFLLLGALLHATYFQGKYAQTHPYGQLVEVGDGQMHVYAMGHGEKTIVLLPGLGIPLPSADFAPLMRKLSEKYTVVCVEYFGVGFSSQTTLPRTCENYVEETRTALSQAGFKAPYVLMPHSISSVYSEYYAAKYPQEVEAIISLDGTSTAYYAEMPANFKSILQIAKFQQAIGLSSFLSPLIVDKDDWSAKGYTSSEIDDAIVFAAFSLNDTVLEQMANTSEFIKQTMELPFPESVPYFKIISRQTYETPSKQLKITPQEYQQQHLERIGQQAKYEILEGNHFIYQKNVDRIAEITDDLLLNGNK
jgi:pimeloyl-ACP methyl ester carboxylesterase